jgi:hypothetical protein
LPVAIFFNLKTSLYFGAVLEKISSFWISQ